MAISDAMLDDAAETSSHDSEDATNDESSASETEFMVNTRARRTTAGNRYDSLIAQEEIVEEEEADDEVALLFAEADGEDEEYQSADGDDEADMSSSDDDDAGPNAGGEDLDGEKDIKKEAKIQRARKRKAELALTSIAAIKKKPKIDPTSLRRATAPKPSKRKERVSWLPDSKTAPGRVSLRKQTIAHRAETLTKLKENEEQRRKQKKIREQREKERAAEAPKEMTQADRLAEAERVERRNAKSLNRWEAMEKKRAEEQAARLAALKERKLEGAVVTFYSSAHKYIGHKEVEVIERETTTEPKKRGRKTKAFHEMMAAARSSQANASMASSSQAINAPLDPNKTISSSQTTVSADGVQTQITFTEPKGPDNFFLTGIHEYASMPPENSSAQSAGSKVEQQISITTPTDPQVVQVELTPATPNVPAKLVEDEQQVPDPKQVPAAPSEGIKPPLERDHSSKQPSIMEDTRPANEIVEPVSSTNLESSTNATTPTKMEQTESTQQQPVPTGVSSQAAEPDTSEVAQSQPKAQIEVISTRNLVILDKFDNLSNQARTDFSLFYNTRKSAKPVKHTTELCPMSGLPVRYQDPASGIGYGNAAAYQKLQELRKHRYAWSSMLGCYVGRTDLVARGVPDGFMGT